MDISQWFKMLKANGSFKLLLKSVKFSLKHILEPTQPNIKVRYLTHQEYFNPHQVSFERR